MYEWRVSVSLCHLHFLSGSYKLWENFMSCIEFVSKEKILQVFSICLHFLLTSSQYRHSSLEPPSYFPCDFKLFPTELFRFIQLSAWVAIKKRKRKESATKNTFILCILIDVPILTYISIFPLQIGRHTWKHHETNLEHFYPGPNCMADKMR